MRLLDCFRAFDVERAGSLSYESLYGGLSWLGVELSPTQMLDLAKRVNVSGTGVVSREEFEIAFGPDDDWQKEWEEEDRVNAVGGGHKSTSKCEWQHKHEQHDDGVSIPIQPRRDSSVFK